MWVIVHFHKQLQKLLMTSDPYRSHKTVLCAGHDRTRWFIYVNMVDWFNRFVVGEFEIKPFHGIFLMLIRSMFMLIPVNHSYLLPVDDLIPFSYIKMQKKKERKEKKKTTTGKKKATNETKTKINDLQKKQAWNPFVGAHHMRCVPMNNKCFVDLCLWTRRQLMNYGLLFLAKHSNGTRWWQSGTNSTFLFTFLSLSLFLSVWSAELVTLSLEEDSLAAYAHGVSQRTPTSALWQPGNC